MSAKNVITQQRNDIAAERAVLAGLLKYGNTSYTDVNDIIDVGCFTDRSNQILYSCLDKLLQRDSKPDVPGILSVSKELGLDSFVDTPTEIKYINSLYNFHVEQENIRGFAKKLKKIFIIKELQSLNTDIYNSLKNLTGNEDISEILSTMEDPIFDYTNTLSKSDSSKPQKLFEGIEEYVDFLENNPTDNMGISTGFSIFDNVIGGGIRKGGVALIIARPKQGKTTLGKEISLHVGGKLNIPVLILDTEMASEDHKHRSLASLTGIDVNIIESGKFKEHQRKSLNQAAQLLKDMPIHFKSVAGKPFEEILSIMRRWIFQEVGYIDGQLGNCLIVYDYFKLMDANTLNNMQEYQAMGFQISKFVDFCNKYKVPALAFVQANRDGISKDSTDVISQSDRLLWLCSSASLLKRKSKEEIVQDGNTNGNMKLIPLECRFGPGLDDGDHINLLFEGNIARFTEINTRSSMKNNAIETEDNESPFD